MKPVTRHDLRLIGDYRCRNPEVVPTGHARPGSRFLRRCDILGKGTGRPLARTVGQHGHPAGHRRTSLAMPDIHQGYGFPIGGVVATRLSDWVVSPGGVGYDINCGIRLLAGHLDADEIRPHLPDLADALYRHIPSGVGVKGQLHTNKVSWTASWRRAACGRCTRGTPPAWISLTPNRRGMAGADPAKVSSEAETPRAGPGGHPGLGQSFRRKIDAVSKISTPRRPTCIGLRRNQVVVQFHCGSRGGGSGCDRTRNRGSLERASRRFGGPAAPTTGVRTAGFARKASNDLAAMNCAANYAWNRQVLTYRVREAFEEVGPGKCPLGKPSRLARCPQYGQALVLIVGGGDDGDGRGGRTRGRRAPQGRHARVRARPP